MGTRMREETMELSQNIIIKPSLTEIITSDIKSKPSGQFTRRNISIDIDSEKETSCIVMEFLDAQLDIMDTKAFGAPEQCNEYDLAPEDYIKTLEKLPKRLRTRMRYQSAGFYTVNIKVRDMFNHLEKQHILRAFADDEPCQVPEITFEKHAPLFYEPREVMQDDFTTVATNLRNHLSCDFLNNYVSSWVVEKVHASTGVAITMVANDDYIATTHSVSFAPKTLESYATYSVKRVVQFDGFTVESATFLKVRPPLLRLTIDNGRDFTRYISSQSGTVTLTANTTYEHDVSMSYVSHNT